MPRRELRRRWRPRTRPTARARINTTWRQVRHLAIFHGMDQTLRIISAKSHLSVLCPGRESNMAEAASGTVWQYYQMVNTLNPCSPRQLALIFPPINDANSTINLNVYANSAIEFYFQTTTCMSCHGSAAGNGVPRPFTGTNQIFTFVLQYAYWPDASAVEVRKKLLRLFRNPPPAKLAAPATEKPHEIRELSLRRRTASGRRRRSAIEVSATSSPVPGCGTAVSSRRQGIARLRPG